MDVLTSKYTLAWFGMMVLAIFNGAVRDLAYKDRVGGLAAHQISTFSLILLFAVYIRLLSNRWPITTSKQAWSIGAIWFVLTEVFEFGMGRLISGESWEKLFQAYNVLDGQLWVLIPLWVLTAPYVLFRIARTRQTAP